MKKRFAYKNSNKPRRPYHELMCSQCRTYPGRRKRVPGGQLKLLCDACWAEAWQPEDAREEQA